MKLRLADGSFRFFTDEVCRFLTSLRLEELFLALGESRESESTFTNNTSVNLTILVLVYTNAVFIYVYT